MNDELEQREVISRPRSFGKSIEQLGILFEAHRAGISMAVITPEGSVRTEAAYQAAIQHERQKAAREALEGLAERATAIGSEPGMSAERLDAFLRVIDEALKELDGFDWRQGYGGFGYESTKTV